MVATSDGKPGWHDEEREHRLLERRHWKLLRWISALSAIAAVGALTAAIKASVSASRAKVVELFGPWGAAATWVTPSQGRSVAMSA
jgi:hypothetical protein